MISIHDLIPVQCERRKISRRPSDSKPHAGPAFGDDNCDVDAVLCPRAPDAIQRLAMKYSNIATMDWKYGYDVFSSWIMTISRGNPDSIFYEHGIAALVIRRREKMVNAVEGIVRDFDLPRPGNQGIAGFSVAELLVEDEGMLPRREYVINELATHEFGPWHDQSGFDRNFLRPVRWLAQSLFLSTWTLEEISKLITSVDDYYRENYIELP